jgi:hypothetical protein
MSQRVVGEEHVARGLEHAHMPSGMHHVGILIIRHLVSQQYRVALHYLDIARRRGNRRLRIVVHALGGEHDRLAFRDGIAVIRSHSPPAAGQHEKGYR